MENQYFLSNVVTLPMPDPKDSQDVTLDFSELIEKLIDRIGEQDKRIASVEEVVANLGALVCSQQAAMQVMARALAAQEQARENARVKLAEISPLISRSKSKN